MFPNIVELVKLDFFLHLHLVENTKFHKSQAKER